MNKTWRNYLLSHKDKAEYDESADQIQLITEPKANDTTNFVHLSDHPTLVVLTNSLTDKKVQTTFYHHAIRPSLLASNHEFVALAGFRRRACAMRIETSDMFSLSTKKKFPSFNQLMSCTSLEDIMNLKQLQTFAEEEKLTAHAILPPFLLEILFSDDSMEAQDVLERFIISIHFLRKQREEIFTVDDCAKDPNIEMDDDEMDEGEVANASTEASTSPMEATGPTQPQEDSSEETSPFDTEDRLYERRFGQILRFLWGVTHYGDKVVKPTRMCPCSKQSTESWTDEVHLKCLPSSAILPPLPIPQQGYPAQDGQGLTNAATAIHKLSDIWGKKLDLEEKEKEDREQKKKDKAFANLSEVQQNVLSLISATKNDTDDSVESLKPTEDMLKILELKVGIKAQAHLQHEFCKNKLMCDVGLAMATQMKNGIIMSHPSVNDINGLSPFFLPDTAGEERLSSELSLRLEEQMVLGKINEADLKTITKCKIHFAKNFGEYCHMVRNLHRLIVIVAGEESMFASKTVILHEHALEHERCYKDLERDNYHFYASILDHVHRRCQHYIHSAALGKVSKLKIRKLDFTDMLEEIEDGDYTPVKPKWLKTPNSTNNKKRDSGSGFNEGHEGSHPSTPKKKKKISVDNPHFDNDLKCPDDCQYRVVFHPANRRGLDEIKHDDGTTRCNNWFHRGWCTESCPLKESHNKRLSAPEKIKCKDYLTKLVAKYKRWNESHQGRRNGNPNEQGQ